MMLVSNMREEALEAGYRAMLETPCIANRVNFSCDEFKKGCENFEVYGFLDKEMAGMTFLDGNHSHIAVLKKFHGKCGTVIKQALSLFLEKNDDLVAEVHKDNKKAIRFVERLGFKYKGSNEEILTYTLGDKNVL